jgi:hypothetical protein
MLITRVWVSYVNTSYSRAPKNNQFGLLFLFLFGFSERDKCSYEADPMQVFEISGSFL